MKDLVCYLLDINIPVQSNAAKKKLFDLAIVVIDYYWPVQSIIPTKSIFLQLAQLNSLIDLSTDPDYTESKSFNDNCGKSNGDMSDRVDGDELIPEKKFVTEEKFETEEKLDMEETMKTKDLESLKQLMSKQFYFFSKRNLGISYRHAKTSNGIHWSQLRRTSLLHEMLRLL